MVSVIFAVESVEFGSVIAEVAVDKADNIVENSADNFADNSDSLVDT